MKNRKLAAVVAQLVTACLTTAAILFNLCACSYAPAITTEKPYERVAVLFSSLAEMWIDAGGTVDITVGEAVERGLVSEEVLLVDEGAGKNINLELLVSYEPSLVICSADIAAQVEAAEFLNKNGIKALTFHVETFEDYSSVMEEFTAMTGNNAAFDKFVLEQSDSISALLSSDEITNAHGKTVLFVRAGSSASSTKAKLPEDHFACAMLEEFGCVNIASAAPILLDGLNMEYILIADPDYVFFSLMGKEDAALANVNLLLESDVWQGLSAVKEDRVVILPRELFHFKPCSRWSEAYSYIADILTEE